MRLQVYFNDKEKDAIFALSRRELRAPRDQVALIVHNELVRLGLLDKNSPVSNQPAGQEVRDGQQ